MQTSIQDQASTGLGSLQALMIARFAPRALSLATTLFRRHPVLFVGGVAIAAWAWHQRRSSGEALTSRAGLVH